MTYILKDKDKNILSYSQASFILDPVTGETIEYTDLSFYEYARRLVLSHRGVSGSTIQAYQGGPDVDIDVSINSDVRSVDIDINGTVETVQLTDGKGKLLLSTAQPGILILTPGDRKTYCSAGSGLLVVEVAPNA